MIHLRKGSKIVPCEEDRDRSHPRFLECWMKHFVLLDKLRPGQLRDPLPSMQWKIGRQGSVMR